MTKRASFSTARGGFTLLEALLVVAVLAMLAGAAIPLASKALTSAARRATREELVRIGVAAQEHFRDTHAAPRTIRDLETASGAAGWDGPYLDGAVRDPDRTDADFALDAWSRAYRLKVAGDLLTVTSAGPDAALDTPDDVRIQADFTPIRREETGLELEAIRRALASYNGLRGADRPLPGSWREALPRLVDAGLLPDHDTYLSDAWGNAYAAEPDGVAPLVRVVSTSVGAAATPRALPPPARDDSPARG